MTFMEPVAPKRTFRISLLLSSEQDLGKWGEPTPEWIEKMLAQPMASIFQASDILVEEVPPPLWVRLGTRLLGTVWHLDHCPHCVRVEGGHRPCWWWQDTFIVRVSEVA